MSYFYRTPACKALCIASLFLPAVRYLNAALPRSPATAMTHKLLATLTPSSSYCILPLLIILWKYRVVERRLGTWQFIQLSFFGTLISVLISRASHVFISPTEDEITNIFISLICVLFPLFLAELPIQLEAISLLVSENALVGLILLQFLLLEPSSRRSSVVSVAVGGILELSWCALHQSFYLSLPEKLKEMGESLFKWFPDDRPPRNPLSGATLEAQRSQIMDLQEANFRNIAQQNHLPGWIGGRRWAGNVPRPRPRAPQRLPNPAANLNASLPPNVTEEKLQQLCDMGFDRANSLIALSHSGGEVELAATILIAEKN